MVSPDPVNVSGQRPIAQVPPVNDASKANDPTTAGGYIRNWGFHVIAVLLGIALAFM